MPLEQLKVSANNFGFDGGWVADILQQYGPDVLALAVEAARNGFSVSLIVEVVQKFGPAMLDLLVSLLNQKNSQAMRMAMNEVVPGNVITADNVGSIDPALIDILIQKYLPQIINTILPQLINTYGPQILQMILNALLQNFQKK